MRIEPKNDYYSAKSMGASFSDGLAMVLDNIYGYSFDCQWTGTPAGDLIVQGSNTKDTWHEIDKVTIAGAVGTKLFNVNGAFYRFTRLVWVQTGSTGTLNARYMSKGN
jgi:hypothetical protein